ncbi:MAG: hypothetical protein LBJ76_04245 [Candidatus Accumulibacter sp.]|jgi:phage-related protein|nr:hypothetical protein [Accumulibacter sp.]
MAVLDTFLILFEADSSKLKKGLDNAEDSAKKTQSTFAKVDDKAKMLGTKFKSLISNAAKLAIGTIALSSFKALTEESIRQNVELGKQADNLRVNVERLQQWQGAFASVGSSAESINGLFAKIGQTTRDPEARIFSIADRMKNMSEYGRQRLGKTLGLDADAIRLMSQGSGKIKELMEREKELGIVTKEEIEASKKAAEQMRVASRLMGDMRNRLAMGLLPAFNWVIGALQKFIRFIREHGPFAKAFFVGLAVGITAMYLPALMKAIAATAGWLAPFLAIGAAATAIALIFDDIITYFQGGDSVIGRLAERFPWIHEVMERIRVVVMTVVDLFKGLGEIVMSVGSKIVEIAPELLDGFMNAIDTIYDAFVDLFDGYIKPMFEMLMGFVNLFGAIFTGDIDGIVNAFGNIEKAAKKIFGFMLEKLQKIGGFVKRIFGIGDDSEEKPSNDGENVPGGGEKLTNEDYSQMLATGGIPEPLQVEQAAEKGRQMLAEANGTPLSARTEGVNAANMSAGNQTSNSTVNIAEVTVQTQATDADGIAKGINQGLQNELKGATAQFDNGVAA